MHINLFANNNLKHDHSLQWQSLLETPLLYNVSVDPSERFNIADQHPEIISEIRSLLEEHQEGVHQK